MITTHLKAKNSLHEFLALNTYLSSFLKEKQMLKYRLQYCLKCMDYYV